MGGLGHELGSAVGGTEGPGTGPGSNGSGSGSGSGTVSAGSGFKGSNIFGHNGNGRPSALTLAQIVWQAARTHDSGSAVGGVESSGTGLLSGTCGADFSSGHGLPSDSKGFQGTALAPVLALVLARVQMA